MTIFTIGHSTRPIDELVSLLGENGITLLVDVRRFPGSRTNPQYNAESLSSSLQAAGIAYRHEPDLGGRRNARPDSKNTAWRNSGFRGYADWMGSAAFAHALDQLVAEATARTTAVMCAEAVPWQCHRNLLADACVLRAIDILHIMGAGATRTHEVHESARRAEDGTVTYPGSPEQFDLI